MNKVLVVVMAGSLALASPDVFGQGTAAPKSQADKGSAAAYQNPAAEKTQTQKAKEGMSAAELSKMNPRPPKSKVNDPDALKRAQALSSSGTNQAEAKANVAKSQASGSRTKLPNVKDLTPEERNELRRQLQELSTP